MLHRSLTACSALAVTGVGESLTAQDSVCLLLYANSIDDWFTLLLDICGCGSTVIVLQCYALRQCRMVCLAYYHARM